MLWVRVTEHTRDLNCCLKTLTFVDSNINIGYFLCFKRMSSSSSAKFLPIPIQPSPRSMSKLSIVALINWTENIHWPLNKRQVITILYNMNPSVYFRNDLFLIGHNLCSPDDNTTEYGRGIGTDAFFASSLLKKKNFRLENVSNNSRKRCSVKRRKEIGTKMKSDFFKILFIYYVWFLLCAYI